MYSSLISNPMKLTFNPFAATHSEPEPTKGTTNKVLSLFFDALSKISHNANGFCVG